MNTTARRPWATRILAEFTLIVVGVLVAFALEGWWTARLDREAEREYVSDLRDELARNEAALTGVGRLRDDAVSAIRNALRLIEAGSHEDSAELVVLDLVRGGSFETIPRFSSAVFQDLQNSGRLQLIRDDGLRRSIMQHYSDLDATLVRLRGAQQQVQSGLPALLARHLPPDVVAWEPGAGPLAIEPASGADAESFRGVAQDLVADPSLRPEIRAHVVALQVEESRLGRFRRILDSQREVLDAALAGF